MKKLILSLCLILSTTACDGSTEHGECVGFGKYRSPNKVYELSTYNAVVTALLPYTVVVPVVWALEYAYCPVADKALVVQ